MNNYKKLNNERFPEPIGAYSNGLVIPIGDKNMILLTGQVATDKTGQAQFVENPAKQTEFIFKNIESLLAEAGATIDNIVKVVIYVTDMNYFKDVSPVRNEYLSNCKPVSTLVEVNKLAVDECKVEIEVTAIK